MKNTLIPRPATEPPVEADLEKWCRAFALSPATDDRGRRDRWIVLQVLADLEASR